jgi:hypothetical protein
MAQCLLDGGSVKVQKHLVAFMMLRTARPFAGR